MITIILGAVNGRGAGCCYGQTHPMGIYPLLICLLSAWNEEVSGSCEHKHFLKQNVSFLITDILSSRIRRLWKGNISIGCVLLRSSADMNGIRLSKLFGVQICFQKWSDEHTLPGETTPLSNIFGETQFSHCLS